MKEKMNMNNVPDSSFLQFGPWKLLLLSILCALCMWTYFYRVLIAHQVRDSTARGTPRGNLSDLYPRWLGSRELLLHGRDPYTPEFTREIQAGYYGRPLDPDAPGERNYQQGFYYPAYVAFCLAPTIHLPFETVRKGFFWVLLGLTLTTVPLWPFVLRWSVPVWVYVSLVVFTIGSLPFIEGIMLQQITLFVVPLLIAALALLASGHPMPAGVLLAFATIKPQLVWLLLLWLMIWTLADWRRRCRWAVSFLLTMVILFAASEWYLPHWIPRFLQAIREYHNFTGEMSVMDEMIGAVWGRALEVSALAILIGICWKERRVAANTEAFALTLSLVLAITVLVVPSYGLYNQVLLIPALLIMLRDRRTIWRRNIANRIVSMITIALIGWPWISGFALAGLSFILPRETVERAWAVPLWTALQIPLAVSALMLVHYYQGYYQRTITASAGPRSS
jgi:hypothetical protein